MRSSTGSRRAFRVFTYDRRGHSQSERPGEGSIEEDVADLAAFIRTNRLAQSPPFFGVVLDRIAAALPNARRHTFHGARHVPHLTAPKDYVQVVSEFLEKVAVGSR